MWGSSVEVGGGRWFGSCRFAVGGRIMGVGMWGGGKEWMVGGGGLEILLLKMG